VTPLQLALDRSGIEPARREQYVAVEPEVCQLRDEPGVVLGGARERSLDAFLADLLRAGRYPLVEHARDVRALRSRGRPLGDDTPEPGREARLRAGVASRARRPHPQQDRVAVAVVPQLLHRERVPGRLALAPQLLPRAAEEVRLACLARQAQ